MCFSAFAFTPTTVSFRSIGENVESPVFSYFTREMSGPKVKEFDSIRAVVAVRGGIRREDSPPAASKRPTQANTHILVVHMHGASQRPKYTNIHIYTCIHCMNVCMHVCILGVSIFWRHYPMCFINSSSSSSACRSTRLPRRQVPVMEYTHNIHTFTHTTHKCTDTALAQQESSERLAQLSSLSSRRSLSLRFVRHCAKMGLGCCQ